jgi:hypothetical protein
MDVGAITALLRNTHKCNDDEVQCVLSLLGFLESNEKDVGECKKNAESIWCDGARRPVTNSDPFDGGKCYRVSYS